MCITTSGNWILFWVPLLLFCTHKGHLLFWKKRNSTYWWIQRKSLVTYSLSSCNNMVFATLHVILCFLPFPKSFLFITVRTETVCTKASFFQREWWGSCFLLVMWKLTFCYVIIQCGVIVLQGIFSPSLSIFLYI